MHFGRNKLYSILISACFAGYIWLFFAFSNNFAKAKSFEVCIIKHITNIPCPSCGSTRSVIAILKCNFYEAFMSNPLGYIVAFILLLSPLWIAFDIATKQQSLFEVYEKIEIQLKRPQYAIPLILLLIFNWIWNITKGI